MTKVTGNIKHNNSKFNMSEVKKILDRYPENKKNSAVIPLLHYAQKQNNGWLSTKELENVAQLLDMSYMRVYEVASFYTMFNLNPVGKYLLQLCKTTPCWLNGSDEVKKCIKDKLKISNGETSKDGLFTLVEVECLGACVNAPILQINNDFFEDLNYETTNALIDNCKKNKLPKSGSMIGRKSSEPFERKILINVKK